MDTRESVASRAGTFDNPGDSVNCGDFATWAEANGWFWKFKQAGFGDAGKLDSNGDGLPCESLSGAPKVPTLPATVDLFRFHRGEQRRLWLSHSATTVVLNITVSHALADGYVQAFPTGGSTAPGTSSNLNVAATEVRASMVIVPVGPDGSITFFHQAGGDLIVDLLGTFTPDSSGSGRRRRALRAGHPWSSPGHPLRAEAVGRFRHSVSSPSGRPASRPPAWRPSCSTSPAPSPTSPATSRCSPTARGPASRRR